MKNYIIYLSLVLATFVGCDKIEQEDFLIGVEGPNEVDTTTFVKKILIEDFTGQTCQNCPEAAEEIHTLQLINTYSNKVVAIVTAPLKHKGWSFIGTVISSYWWILSEIKTLSAIRTSFPTITSFIETKWAFRPM